MKRVSLFIILLISYTFVSAQSESEIITKINAQCKALEEKPKHHLNFSFDFFPEEDYANQYKITGILWHDATKMITIEQSPMGGQGFYRITAFLNGKSVIKLISEEGQAQSYSQKYYYLKNGTALVLIDQRRENNTITGKREVKPQHMNNIHKMILQEDMKWVQQALKYVFNEVDYPEFTKN